MGSGKVWEVWSLPMAWASGLGGEETDQQGSQIALNPAEVPGLGPGRV